MTNGEAILEERVGTTLTLVLNRPEKRNALSEGLVDALSEKLRAAANDGTRLLVLRGSGANFCAGFDMEDYERHSQGDLLLRLVRIEQLLQLLRYAPLDTMALAHGRNFGAGVDLVCACARRVAAPEATFRMPGLRFGLVLGSRLFSRRVGEERARRVLQESTTFDAKDAQAWGFLQEVAAQEEWPRVVELASEAAALLDPAAAARLFSVTTPDNRDADLAELTRSASQPGLKARIADYLAQSSRNAAVRDG